MSPKYDCTEKTNCPHKGKCQFECIVYKVEVWTGSLAKWVECLPMVWETWVQSQVESYQRLLKWYLILPPLILSNIRYVSRVKWSNPGKGVVPSPTPWCSSNGKGSLLIALDYGHQLYLLYLYSCGPNNYNININFKKVYMASTRPLQKNILQS